MTSRFQRSAGGVPSSMQSALVVSSYLFRLAQRNPRDYLHTPIYFQKLESLAYILPLALLVYLHSNFCSALQKTNLFCNAYRSRSSKVDNFGTNRKQVCDFLLVGHCKYLWSYSYLAPFLRYGDLSAENCVFSYPSLIWRPRSLWNFTQKLTTGKLESWGYPPKKTA